MNKIFFKIFVVFCIIFFDISNLKSQNDVLFSNFLLNISLNSPSNLSLNNNPSIILTYRNHYPALSSAYTTYVFQYYHFFDKLNSGISSGVMNDIQGSGIFQIFCPFFSYRYLINLNESFKIASGIQYMHIVKKINSSKLIFETDLTGDINDYDLKYNTTIPDFSVGLSIFYKKFFSSISFFHLFSVNSTENIPLRFSFSGCYTDIFDKNKTITTAFKFDFQDKFKTLIYGTKIQYNIFTFGSWLRNNLPFNLDSWSIMLGINFISYNIFYNFDVNLKKFANFNSGFSCHEVTFLYEFKYNKNKKKKIEKLKCPKIVN